MSAPPIIALEHVRLSFGSHVVHRDISFAVAPGESLTILGPSGTGKTLILKMVAGLLDPDGGIVRVLGSEMNTIEEEERVPLRSNIGMLFQGAALFDSLSVADNIAYPLREAGERDEVTIANRVSELLELIGLPGSEEKFPAQLSGGQKKRVGLARALSRSPKILLFDEPTTGLDPTSTRLIDDLIVRLQDERSMTSIAVTHDIASARRISSRWLLIDNGQVIADGAVGEVSNNNPAVVSFISGNWKEQ